MTTKSDNAKKINKIIELGYTLNVHDRTLTYGTKLVQLDFVLNTSNFRSLMGLLKQEIKSENKRIELYKPDKNHLKQMVNSLEITANFLVDSLENNISVDFIYSFSQEVYSLKDKYIDLINKL